jgi:disease resistance protein RPM1
MQIAEHRPPQGVCRGRNKEASPEMETMVVSASKGVMNSLLAKLAALMGEEFKKFKGVRKQVSFLKDELSTMNSFLEMLDLVDELNPLAKEWRSHVREMAYDIEDCIDYFMHHLGNANPKKDFIKKTACRLKTLRHRHHIAHQIDELKARVLEASERRTRYMLDELACISGSVPVDPRVHALYTEAENLVGIDGPREELVEWLTKAEQQLRVVSIVGFGASVKLHSPRRCIIISDSNSVVRYLFQFLKDLI